jgi:hypothetical protein
LVAVANSDEVPFLIGVIRLAAVDGNMNDRNPAIEIPAQAVSCVRIVEYVTVLRYDVAVLRWQAWRVRCGMGHPS